MVCADPVAIAVGVVAAVRSFLNCELERILNARKILNYKRHESDKELVMLSCLACRSKVLRHTHSPLPPLHGESRS